MIVTVLCRVMKAFFHGLGKWNFRGFVKSYAVMERNVLIDFYQKDVKEFTGKNYNIGNKPAMSDWSEEGIQRMRCRRRGG